jgi:hypothetical protein
MSEGKQLRKDATMCLLMFERVACFFCNFMTMCISKYCVFVFTGQNIVSLCLQLIGLLDVYCVVSLLISGYLFPDNSDLSAHYCHVTSKPD